jgi:imidazolonepropionase-like amidohydrolase
MRLGGFLALFLTGPLLGQEQPLVLTGGRVIAVAGAAFDPGVLVVQHGKIVAAGPKDLATPANAMVRDVSGKVILPGLVDTHSHIGDVALGDPSAPVQSELRALDSIDVHDSSIQRAQAGGITTANVMPGSGLLVGGQTLYLKLRDGNTIDDLLITNRAGRIAGGLKMANGTNPRKEPPFPGTRAKAAALVREKFIAAQEYREKLARAGNDADKRPARDLTLEALAEALAGERVVHHHTHRHDDILTVLRLQQEFGFRLVLQHVTDAWKVADEIAAAKVPCSIINVDSPGGKLETRDLEWKTGAVLENAGVLTAIHTDDYITDSRLFLRSAALAVRAGMTPTGALKALTLNGARMLDLDDRLGSLEPGKDADFILLSGDPLSVYTQVLETWVEGQKVFDRALPPDRLWATGGYGAGNPRKAHLCCYETGEAAQ